MPLQHTFKLRERTREECGGNKFQIGCLLPYRTPAAHACCNKLVLETAENRIPSAPPPLLPKREASLFEWNGMESPLHFRSKCNR
ncbi:hypothetical protein NPIL_227761 [Nephila pilipes]|uniref:Uncharacterized protein n=1 Tax=Nephila pilipes TaxID=299642 RepID=A0A8X6JQH1_NEPPI|nr:hypothetical protein NPIL_227761 [Nephila pilipes]